MNAANAISITLNGKPKDVPSESTVSDLLDMLELRERLVVVERNGAILNRSDFAQTSIERGDVLEIVHFVGGGCIERRVPEMPLQVDLVLGDERDSFIEQGVAHYIRVTEVPTTAQESDSVDDTVARQIEFRRR